MASTMEHEPEILAQRQLDAYNNRDVEAFLAVYAEDVAVYNYPDQLSYTGKPKMRARYAELFENAPKLHCRLVNRIVRGDRVIDHESVSGTPAGTFEAVAIYTIANGLIARVDFIK